MRYKAVFFDRDGTLTYNDPAWEQLRRDCIREWSGRDLDESYDFFIKHFRRVLDGGYPFAPYHTVGQERSFFRQWYLSVFEELGITEKCAERADYLTERLWYLKKQPYPETVEALEQFRSHGYRMGVISDSPPSLELTLTDCGLHRYFTSFTASSLVGYGKPDARIYLAALNAQGVTAAESLYVDDCAEEADGARALGFTAFHLDRSRTLTDPRVIHDLRELADYAGVSG